jgi:multicomponent Na+:H+ antiporter subunit G
VAVKLLFILIFLLLTSPTASHALAKAARHGGLFSIPEIKDDSSDNEGSKEEGKS